MKVNHLNVRTNNIDKKKKYKLERKAIAAGFLIMGTMTGIFVGSQLKDPKEPISTATAIIEEEDDYNPAVLTPNLSNYEVIDNEGAELLFLEGENNFKAFLKISNKGEYRGNHIYLSEGDYSVIMRYNGNNYTENFHVEDGEQIQLGIDFANGEIQFDRIEEINTITR